MYRVALLDENSQLRCSASFHSLEEAKRSYLQAREQQNQFDVSSLLVLERGRERVNWHFHKKCRVLPKTSGVRLRIGPLSRRAGRDIGRCDTSSLKDKVIFVIKRLLTTK